MLRSMYSGISGLKNFQLKLDVIGNNIANVNTYGYKKGRTTFSDIVSQTIAASTAPSNDMGGTNTKQIGLGARLATTDTIHTQGSVQMTNRPLDIAISGDGYFIINDGNDDLYTRAGNFYLDEEGKVVDGNGFYLQKAGGGEIEIPDDAKSFSIGKDGTVSIVKADNSIDSKQKISLAIFPNADGLEKSGNNLYRLSNNSGNATDVQPGADGAGELISGALEMSNVDLSEEFTEMIVAQRGFQANTRIITTSDEILQELVNLKR
ncbi:flagellar basal body rod protein FlgG [Bacillus sp. HMF5848]|uniref:flagellar basal body rod protein FlgG n=1 Tax=Bacillus sp. HMF5848 TaxID=2495421 RepID=UPI000F78A613|nr:flagellar basal body rod protein FlgG [Bacillus sp. HMF5848]RSK27034.1 flagellar basal body rod protein FlgG [Bacillus sp. HMF5848]